MTVTQHLQFLNSASTHNKRQKRFVTEGINVRGESFRITYYTRFDAEDFAAEIRSKGGTATTRPL